MPRRGRRLGVRFLMDEEARNRMFFKRRDGLFKAASDLSTLTGARILVVLGSPNGKMYAFGSPSVETIMDDFLSGCPKMDSFTNEEQKAKITYLQNQPFQLEKEKAVENKRKKKVMALAEEVQECSGMAKLFFSKVEDLDVSDRVELLYKLSLVMQEIEHRLASLQHQGNQSKVDQIRDLTLQQSSWLYSLSSQIPPPARRSPWIPFQPSLQLQQPSGSHLASPQFPSARPLESQLPHLGMQKNNSVELPQNYEREMNLDTNNKGDNGGKASGSYNVLDFSGPLQGDV